MKKKWINFWYYFEWNGRFGSNSGKMIFKKQKLYNILFVCGIILIIILEIIRLLKL